MCAERAPGPLPPNFSLASTFFEFIRLGSLLLFLFLVLFLSHSLPAMTHELCPRSGVLLYTQCTCLCVCVCVGVCSGVCAGVLVSVSLHRQLSAYTLQFLACHLFGPTFSPPFALFHSSRSPTPSLALLPSPFPFCFASFAFLFYFSISISFSLFFFLFCALFQANVIYSGPRSCKKASEGKRSAKKRIGEKRETVNGKAGKDEQDLRKKKKTGTL